MALLLSLILLAQDDPAKLIEGLRSESAAERDAAALKLGRAGPAAVPLLQEAAKDKDAEVAARATRILGIIRFREALSPAIRSKHPLIEEQVTDRPKIATRIFLDLPELKPDRENPVDEEIPDPFPRSDLRLLAGLAVRGATEEELGDLLIKIHERDLVEAGPALVPFLTHEDHHLRGMAAESLGRLRHRAAIPGLFRLLEDKSGDNREIAAYALVELDAREIIPALRRQLKLDDPEIRNCAVKLLGDFNDRESAPDLVAICRNSKEVEWGVLQALVAMDLPDAAPFLLVPARTGTAQERESAMWLLAAIRSRDAVPFLLPALQIAEITTVARTLEALGDIGDPAAIPKVQPLLNHENALVSGSALFALAGMGSKGVLPEILRSLKEGDANRKWFAVRALGGLKSKEHATLLIPLTQDRDVPLRWAAMDALGRIGGVEALPALEKCAGSRLKGDREHSRKAIQAIQSRPR